MNKTILLAILLSHTLSFAQATETESSAAAVAETAAEANEPAAELIPENAEASPKQAVEKVEVTGSRIKRIDVEGVAPVTTLNRVEIEKSGYNSVSDVLRDTTMSSFGGMKEASGSNAAGNAEVNLRGLGSTNTLVLLNGQRLPSDAVTGAVDLNLVPMAAVERIEILKDGASALYGSDALGGVVNIITRKDFTGNQISTTLTQPEMKGGQRAEVSLVNGVNGNGFNMVNVIQYRDNKSIYSRDREWSNNGKSDIGDPGSYANADDTWNADPNCPADRIITTPDGKFCEFKHSDYSTQLPALQQIGILSETNFEVNSKLHLTARVGGTHKKVQWSYAPAPGTFEIPASIARTLGPGGTPLPGTDPNKDLEVLYRLGALGTRDTKIETTSYNLMLGGSYLLTDVWTVDVTTSHNIVESANRAVNGYALTKELNAAIADGTFNPFAPAGQRGSLDSTRYNPEELTRSQLSSLEVKASGEAGQMESGPIGIALGTSLTFQSYADRFDMMSVQPKTVFGNAGSSGGGNRSIGAVYSELSIPITDKLELQLAGRHDRYSDFGTSTNPKAGFLYKPSNTLLFRGSVGTGFKAPMMQELYAATSEGYPTFIDAVSCKRQQDLGGETPACTPKQYLAGSSGNTGLKEEKSLSYNLGMIVEPNENLSFGFDAFLTKMSNVVGIDYDDLMLAELNGADLPSQGVTVTRDGNKVLKKIDAPLQNLSAREISGVDLTTTVRFTPKVRVRIDHSQLFLFKEEGFPGSGARNKLGEYGMPAWRNVVSLGYTLSQGTDLSLAALTTASQENSVKGSGRVQQYTSYDLSYSHATKTLGIFGLGVKNLLGSKPPLDSSKPTEPLNNDIYDQVGRQFIASYKMTF